MEIKSVLVEKTSNKRYSSSGVMINKKYVIITSQILSKTFSNADIEYFNNLNSGTLYFCPSGTKFDSDLKAIWKNSDEHFIVEKCKVYGIFICGNVKNTNPECFKDWTVDNVEDPAVLPQYLSLLFLLKLENSEGTFTDLKQTLKSLYDAISGEELVKGDEVSCSSAAFGNRQFLNSTSKGVVSNIFGENTCLILSDCPTTPASEGSPIFIKKQNKQCLVGIVLSSTISWQKEWVGLTLVLDLKPIFCQIFDIPLNRNKSISNHTTHHSLLSATEHSLVQVFSENLNGTAILVSKEKGIFITNSHVIANDNSTVNLKWNMNNFTGEVIYKSKPSDPYDLAFLRCRIPNKDYTVQLKSCILRESENYKLGDPVYTAGFSLVSKNANPSPTICKGYISAVDRFMLKTTCSVHPGTSGGGVFNQNGELIGIVVCNVKLENGSVFPRFSVAIPVSAICVGVNRFVENGDISTLKKVVEGTREAQVIWHRLEGKL